MTSAWLGRSNPDANSETLWGPEVFWKDHFSWFEEQGYQLRPRYAPDWIPSWTRTKKFVLECEDYYSIPYGQINDALHIPTGLRVALKKVKKEDYPFEEDIIRYLSSEPLSKDLRNHCAPLLDVLHPPLKEGDDVQILVMPYLRPFDSPIFDTFGEAIECIRQLFEGLQFMHENHVAHRDLKSNNFMMESEKMYPDGFHHFLVVDKPDLSGTAKFYTRTQRPSKYFIIDFGMSRRYEPGDDSPLEPTILPDGKTEALQNPFQVDVYLAGNLVRERFLDGQPMLEEIQGYKGFEFLRPLINDMVLNEPSERPKMDEVNKRFQDIVKGLSSWKLRSRTSYRSSTVIEEVGHFLSHWGRKMVFVLLRTPVIPRA